MNRLLRAAATTLVLAGCAGNALSPQAMRVTVESASANLKSCESLGVVNAQLTRTRHEYTLLREQGYPPSQFWHGGFDIDLQNDARNRAAALGGDRIVRQGRYRDSSQPWNVYRCGA